MTSLVPRFDRVAHLYRAMEYLSFGPMLECCRFFHLPSLGAARRALVIGDGDGRFLARLLAQNRALQADAVDASPAMLRRLASRAIRIGAQHRVATFCADACAFAPPATGYDLVATHFFLDCLTGEEAATLILRILPHLAPGAVWLVSEFQVPAGSRLRAWLSRQTIAGLYAAFGLLTGLSVRQIPPWRDLLAQAGFTRGTSRTWLGGMLVSELWESPRATASGVAQPQLEMSESPQRAGSLSGIDPGPEPAPVIPPAPGLNPHPVPDETPTPFRTQGLFRLRIP